MRDGDGCYCAAYGAECFSTSVEEDAEESDDEGAEGDGLMIVMAMMMTTMPLHYWVLSFFSSFIPRLAAMLLALTASYSTA